MSQLVLRGTIGLFLWLSLGAEAATTPFVPAVSEEDVPEGRCFCVYIIVLLLFHFYSSFLLSSTF